MSATLNGRAARVVNRQILRRRRKLKVSVTRNKKTGLVIDCGVEAVGSREAGLAMVRALTANLAKVSVVPLQLGGQTVEHVYLSTDHPTRALLGGQYAGQQVTGEKYFAMGSGTMRLALGQETLVEEIGCKESPSLIVGGLETNQLPTADIVAQLAEWSGVETAKVSLLVARTASYAGMLQVVARGPETCMHMLHELSYPLDRVEQIAGWMPLPHVPKNDLTGIGWTNDSVLYGSQVIVDIEHDDDAALAAIAEKVPSSSSSSHGKPFAVLFEEAGHDFYQMDKALFAPALVQFRIRKTGKVITVGNIALDVLTKHSFLAV